MISAGRRSACVRAPSPPRSSTMRLSSISAALPARVVVSRASTRMCNSGLSSQQTTLDVQFVRWRRKAGAESLYTTKHMSATVTPAMRQYLDAKQQHRDAILLFRMGDFYEIFYEDALVAARTLEITLTSRSKDANGGGIPMCGVPFHAVDGYIARLVKRGFRVAICEQVEDPRKAKGVVKREVVRVVSPGTLTDANYLDAREPAFLMAVYPAPGSRSSEPRGTKGAAAEAGLIGVALLDLSTGEFSAAEYAGADGL